MFAKMRAMQIATKLPLIMISLVVFSIGMMTFSAYLNIKTAIVEEADLRLQNIAQLQTKRIQRLLNAIENDLYVQANNPATAEAIEAFSRAFNALDNPKQELQKVYIEDNPNPLGHKDNMASAQNGTPYDAVHALYHPSFNRLQDAMGYYDVFLFDADGNLVYSVFKELDYATNMLNGAWKDTDLAEVFRRANVIAGDADAVFEDFAPYAPSADAPAAFIARPVFDPAGRRVGVLAYQMPVDEISAVLNDTEGLGQTGSAFIVGEDGFLRSDKALTEENDILTLQVDNPAVRLGMTGESGLLEYVDVKGANVVGYVQPVEFLGVNYVTIAQEDSAELFAHLRSSMIIEASQGGMLLIVAIAVALFFSRSLSRPLRQLNEAVGAVSSGDFGSEIAGTHRQDEIGQIATALDRFRSQLGAAAEAERDAAFKGAAFEASGAPMLLISPEFKILRLNQSMNRIMERRRGDFEAIVPNFDPAAVAGQNVSMFSAIPAIDTQQIAQSDTLPIKTKIAVGNAFFGLFLDVVRSNNEIIGYVMELRDETFSMSAQTVVQAINGSQASVQLDTKGTVLSANDIFCKTFNMSKTSLVGRVLKDNIDSQSEDGVESKSWIKVDLKNSENGHFVVRLNDVEKTFNGSISGTADHTGAQGGYLLLGADVTEAKQALEASHRQQEAMTKEQSAVVEKLRVGLEKLSHGDLTAVIDAPFSDSYEALRLDFNNAISKMRDALESIISSSTEIHADTSEIGAAVTELSKRTESQAATLQQTSSALTELTASVKSAAMNTEEVSQTVVGARQDADNSGQIVNDAVRAMREIEQSSSEIFKITSVIDEISFQTNLLALNAGVEAARAGEAGRGFAVVASEVRELARRSSDAALEITNLITASNDQVKHGVSLVDEAGDALSNIVKSFGDISRNIEEIAHASKEQSMGLGEITDAVTDLDQATQMNAAMAEETTAAAHSLGQGTERLQDTTNRFSIGKRPTMRSSKTRATPAAEVLDEQLKSAPVFETSGSLAVKHDDGWDEF